MTQIEAKEFLKCFESKLSEANYLARFNSTKPLVITNPELFQKKIEAEILLGVFKWQKSFEEVKVIHPEITIEKYNTYRVKHEL